MWSYTYTLSYIFMAWEVVNQRNMFTYIWVYVDHWNKESLLVCCLAFALLILEALVRISAQRPTLLTHNSASFFNSTR